MDFGAVLEQEETEAPSLLSLETVKPSIIQIAHSIDKMVADAKALEVKDEESVSFAVSLGGEGKKIAKAIEAKRKDIILGPNEFVKAVNGFCKVFTERLDEMEKTLKKKIADHQYKIELERREAERKAREAAAELQRKLDEDAAQANRKAMEEARKKAEEEALKNQASESERLAAVKAAEEEAARNAVEAPTVIAPSIPEEKKVIRSETGSSSYQAKRWVGIIINGAAVPRQYCEPSQKLINQAITAGVREIPGVEIKEETDVRFRA